MAYKNQIPLGTVDLADDEFIGGKQRNEMKKDTYIHQLFLCYNRHSN